MIEREVLQDIRQYKKKLIGPFTAREFVCILIAFALCLPVYLVLSKYLVRNAVIIIICFIATPFLLCGYKEVYGLPFEKFVIHFLKDKLTASRERKYASTNVYDNLFEKSEIVLTKKEMKEIKKKARKNKEPNYKAI